MEEAVTGLCVGTRVEVAKDRMETRVEVAMEVAKLRGMRIELAKEVTKEVTKEVAKPRVAGRSRRLCMVLQDENIFVLRLKSPTIQPELLRV